MEHELILLAKNGSQPAFLELTELYSPLINSMAEKFRVKAGETTLGADDLRQEALVAFYNALLSFDTEQDKVSFGLYAKICIRNRMISILRKLPSRRAAKEFNSGAAGNPEAGYIENENYRLMLDKFGNTLTKYEKSVFYLYLNGRSYKEIALSLGKPEKSVDNALYRAKTKLRSGYNGYNM